MLPIQQALCKVEGVRQGRLLASQLLDVAIRVKVVRPYAVKHMVRNGAGGRASVGEEGREGQRWEDQGPGAEGLALAHS